MFIQNHVRTGNSLPGHFKTQKQKKKFPPPLQTTSGIHRSVSNTTSYDL